MSTTYGDMRMSLVASIRANHLSPREVAEILSAQRQQFPEIDPREIQSYRAMGDQWRPRLGHFDPEWWEREGKPQMQQGRAAPMAAPQESADDTAPEPEMVP